MTKLKPCPFCGGNAVIRKNEERVKPYMVRCGNMGCGLLMVMTDYFATEEEAIEAWNRRAETNVGKWIPVIERLPEKKTEVIYSLENRYVSTGYMTDRDYEGNLVKLHWEDIESGALIYPEAWMPLPKPYTEGET